MSEAQAVGEEYGHFFEVKLELFDGPIDLLLHLVKQRELPIEKLSLALVTQQYLATVSRVKGFDLELAGEYLLIAATLVSIKAAVLLNQPVELIEDEEGNLVNPHDELLRKLKEAALYKEGAFLLSCRKQLGVDVFAAPSRLGDLPPPPPKYKLHDSMLLGQAFRKMLERLPAHAAYTIRLDSVSVVETMHWVMETLQKTRTPLPLQSLIKDQNSRASLIASFISLLELCKRSIIAITQKETFTDVFVSLRGEFTAEEASNAQFAGEIDSVDESEKAGNS